MKNQTLPAPTETGNRLGSTASLGSVDRPDRWDEGFAAAITALKEMCDDRMGSFRGYSWDSGAGSSGYDEAIREVINWADAVRDSALPNTKVCGADQKA
jgi:hypothetical protein